jgi:hypothetical protein
MTYKWEDGNIFIMHYGLYPEGCCAVCGECQ